MKTFILLLLCLSVDTFSQNIKVTKIDSGILYATVENNTHENLIIYPNSFILKISIHNKLKEIVYNLNHQQNPKNEALISYQDNKRKIDSISNNFKVDLEQATIFWYLLKKSIVIPKYSKQKISFPIFSCLLDNSSKFFFTEKHSAKEKYTFTGDIKFLVKTYLPEIYFSELNSKQYKIIEKIFFCKIPINNFDDLFCDKELH